MLIIFVVVISTERSMSDEKSHEIEVQFMRYLDSACLPPARLDMTFVYEIPSSFFIGMTVLF